MCLYVYICTCKTCTQEKSINSSWLCSTMHILWVLGPNSGIHDAAIKSSFLLSHHNDLFLSGKGTMTFYTCFFSMTQNNQFIRVASTEILNETNLCLWQQPQAQLLTHGGGGVNTKVKWLSYTLKVITVEFTYSLLETIHAMVLFFFSWNLLPSDHTKLFCSWNMWNKFIWLVN